ncbi:MAG: hypothetical protein D6721_08765 [Gammaproteobacteria bacterium]|nr:MAG: hypothetical protein D6721_08765 [Gammaproteobacteria bacterium]
MEYVFFNHAAADRFRAELEAHGLQHEIDALDEDGQCCIRVAEEGLSDDLAERLDTLYDRLLGEADFLGGTDALEKDLAGFEVALSDGTRVTVPIPTELMQKLTAALSLEEIQSLLGAVARAVETRDTRPLCHFD